MKYFPLCTNNPPLSTLLSRWKAKEEKIVDGKLLVTNESDHNKKYVQVTFRCACSHVCKIKLLLMRTWLMFVKVLDMVVKIWENMVKKVI